MPWQDRQKAAALWRAICDGWQPRPALSVSQWADTNRILDSSTSAEPGRWRTDRTPYLREIMDRLSDRDPVQIVVVMAGSQLGKSEAGNNWVGSVMDSTPGPMLMVQPTVEDAEAYSKQRIAPMIAASPALREKVAEPRSRDSGNTLLLKEFPGGFLKMVGSNAPSKLASTPIRFVFLDEIDRFPLDSGGEGDPVSLAYRRTATFPNRKLLLTSTPTVEGFSRIETAYLETDRRQYWVPCPRCGEFQVLHFRPTDTASGGVRWDSGAPHLAWYECDHCRGRIENHEKTTMLARGTWIAGAESKAGAVGYHLSSLYSPHGWVSWGMIATEFLSASKDPEKLKVFANTLLAETWKAGDGAQVKADGLAKRAERYAAPVPAPVLILTAGVDVQDDRLEVEVVGWGPGEESWSIAWHALSGDPTGPAVWRDLDEFLRREWQGVGCTHRIRAVAVDSGYATQDVYRFCKGKESRRIWAVKGHDGPRPVWPKQPRRGARIAPMYSVGVDTAKDSIYARLRVEPPGPGALHFPDSHPSAYYEQLTAERRQVTLYRGRELRKWIKPPGRRNEALDCRVYAYAALQGLATLNVRLPAWVPPAPSPVAPPAVVPTATAAVAAIVSAPAPIIDETPSAPHTVSVPQPKPKRKAGGWFGDDRRGGWW